MVDFPGLEDMITSKIFSYKDRKKHLLMECLASLPLFAGLDEREKHAVVYNMHVHSFPAGSAARLIVPGDSTASLFYLRKGKIVVETVADFRILCVEELSEGAIINHRNFLLEDHQNLVSYTLESLGSK